MTDYIMNLAGNPFIKEERNKSWFYSKIINGLTPDYMYDMIQPYTEIIHDYNLQQISGDNFRLPFCNTVS
jgi:hypothetical protein